MIYYETNIKGLEMPVINFSHQKGGVGKSTLSYHLAYLLKQDHKVILLDLDNQESVSEIDKLRSEDLQKTSLPITKIKNQDELVEVINSIDDDTYLIIDSGGFDSLYTRIAIMGADINITPIADRTMELLAVIKAYDPILSQVSKKLEEDVYCYVLLNRIHHSAKDFAHIDELLSNSKHLRILKDLHKGTEQKTVIRERSIYDKTLVDGMAIHEVELPTNSKEREKHLAARKDIENLRDSIFYHLKNVVNGS